ncbi:hypothetical protein [Congregibacter litoralis]|uniref:Uncharacterized protein n=1 Tax=Congregibacter litoralis KT71 TaxID=314285 RepID=A4A8L2_9GAMM|nr:hypothetical protein [Congregibacter litoralis]EAQ97404.1 hypothetical protein KT71_03825 [Congregibacter litoralis KT71]
MPNVTATSLVACVSAVLLSFTVNATTPGPKIKPSISPQDYSNYRYHNHISNDFSSSDRFDIENPIEVEVEIHQVYLNEDGYVELFYSLPGDSELRLPEGMDPDTPIATFRRATLQTSEEFKRLKLKENDFKRGVTAVLSGWPALPIQQPYSEMLVDEITFGNKDSKSVGKKYILHAESKSMVKYKDKDKTHKEKDKDGVDSSTPQNTPEPGG